MQIPKWAVVLLMALMNVSMSLLTFKAFPDGSGGAIACNVIGAVAANMLAFFGLPLMNKQPQGLQLPDKGVEKIEVKP